MEPRGVRLGLMLVLVTMFCHGTAAQSSCQGALFGLSPCLNYVTGNATTPSASCCTQLLSVVQSQPECLCSALNLSGGGAALGININQTLAMSLPDACDVKAPPISQCSGGNGPTSPVPSSPTPTSPPADSSDYTPDSPAPATQTSIPQPSGNGSKTLPSTNGRASEGSIKETRLKLSAVVIFLVSCIVVKM